MRVELNHHQQYLLQEFADEYHANRLARRDLLKRAVLITGSIPAAAAVLTSLGCGGDDEDKKATPTRAAASASAVGSASASPSASAPASAAASPTASASAAASPAGLETREISFKGPASDLKGYLARPPAAAGKTYPAVVIIHENRGLLDHFKDVARRYANEGYVAVVVDLLSRNGGTTADANQASGLLGAAKPEDLTADMVAYVNYVKELPGVRKAGIAVTGFCFGGNYTWETAIDSPDVAAAVPYYGTVRRLDDLGKTKAAILAIYGREDARVTPQAEEVRKRLTAAGKTIEIKVYDGAQHGFFNDTGGARFNEAAAKDAWVRTLDWFKKYLPQP